jgi:TolA-binding protein
MNLFNLRPRQKRQAMMAATVAVVGAFGAVVGAAASGAFAPKPVPQVNVATLDNHKALEQQIARLNSQVTTLKTSLEAVNKTSTAQLAKINERADRIERNVTGELVTGSISAPQTVPVAPAVTPLPTPRPAPRVAALEVQQPARAQIVQDWAIREARDGNVYVQSHGDIYQVVPGAPLPGLGPVESIKQMDGRWVVKTPRGIIVSMRDRRYFE